MLQDSVELDADEEDDAQEMEIRDIERDLQDSSYLVLSIV